MTHTRMPDGNAKEGGHLHATSGSVVQTRHGDEPYKVVFRHEGGPDTEQSCGSVREGEALIRRLTPAPLPRDTSRDHDGTAGGSA
jgi:hypothetical protein